MTASARPAVYFSGKTALELARSIDLAILPRTRGTANQPPAASPSASDVAAALERFSLAYPSASVSLPAHILVASSSRCRASKTCLPHMSSQRVTANSFYRMGDNLFCSIPALAGIQESMNAKNDVERLELAFELCGTYRTLRTATRSGYDVKPLATVRELRDYAQRNSSLRGARRIAHLARCVADGSASARETKLALIVGLRKMHGGGGAGLPQMNFEVQTTREARAITGKRSLRCDLCWPEFMLDVEYQSKEHYAGESSRISDSRRANALISMGWTVVCVTNDELDSMSAMDTIIDSIRSCAGMKPSRDPSNYRSRKIKLRLQLGLPIEPYGSC